MYLAVITLGSIPCGERMTAFRTWSQRQLQSSHRHDMNSFLFVSLASHRAPIFIARHFLMNPYQRTLVE